MSDQPEIRRLGKYEILAELGRGGMGVVYKAYDPTLDRHVAIKVLAPHLVWEKEFVQRFLREARVAANLRHPGIVAVHEVAQEGDVYYFVMEYLPGKSLAEIIRERGPLSLEETCSIVEQVATALDYAHERGLVHRDVKSANILLDEKGQAVLTDFGIVRAGEGTRLTSAGTALGTPEYMSPEQAKGEEATAASDLYSLGVVVYEMLTGEVPFRAPTPTALLLKHMVETPPPLRTRNASVPEGVEQVVLNALAKEPGARPASGAALVQALARTSSPHLPAAGGGAGVRAVPPTADAPVAQAPLVPLPTPVPVPPGAYPSVPTQAAGPLGAYPPAPTQAAGPLGAYPPVPTQAAGPPAVSPPAAGARKRFPAWAWVIIVAALAGVVVIGLRISRRWAVITPPASVQPTAPAQPTALPATTVVPTPPNERTAAPTAVPTALPTRPLPPAAGDTQIRPADGMVLVYVPAGDFLMGSPADDSQADPDEKPQHTVYLDAFWIDRTEVTVAQFRAFVQATGYSTAQEQTGTGLAWVESAGDWQQVAGTDWRHPNGPESRAVADSPVVQVTWDDAQAYCAWAGGRLPTEAQWEKAARGTTGRIYPWGNAFDGGRLNYCDGRCPLERKDTAYDDGYAYIAPVGSYPAGASPYGALDMLGNVWEWVTDWYDKDYYAVSPARNPTGPPSGNFRLLRGGGWGSARRIVRTALRGLTPSIQLGYVGFRCAVPAP